jgi:hypothetical protein
MRYSTERSPLFPTLAANPYFSTAQLPSDVTNNLDRGNEKRTMGLVRIRIAKSFGERHPDPACNPRPELSLYCGIVCV